MMTNIHTEMQELISEETHHTNKKYTRWKRSHLLFVLLCLYICFDQTYAYNIYDRKDHPQRCAYENVLSNHTFRQNKKAGVFKNLGRTTDIQECKRMCCNQSDCDVAYMPQNQCYAVSCLSDQLCETTPANSENFNVQLVKVRRVVIPDPQGEAPRDEDIIRSSLPGKQKEEEKEQNDEVFFRNPKSYEELVCTHSPILYNVTLKGGSHGGNFTDLGKVATMHLCITLCCEIRKCDLAFMIGLTCIAVTCHNEELCQTIKAKTNNKLPQVAYIRRKERDHKHRDAPPAMQNLIAQPKAEKPAPILRPSTCQARKIYNNATLLGGMRAGNYTSLGRAYHLQDCIGRACDLNEGHLAIMLGKYCYSVMCHNERVCQTIPAKPTHLTPKVAYLTWTQEPIEQDTITTMAESDFFINHKRYPRCKRSHIMYNHTLKGGLRAGNFSMLASVDDIEVCAALCCEEKYCDLALMIGNNCYAGDCASPELCSAVPIPAGSAQRSQIAYITAPGRQKPEDRWVNADWSLVYLIVSALVIGISLLGTAWTVCLCALRRHRRKVKRRKKQLAATLLGNANIKDVDLDIEEPVGTSSRNSFTLTDHEDNEDDKKQFINDKKDKSTNTDSKGPHKVYKEILETSEDICNRLSEKYLKKK